MEEFEPFACSASMLPICWRTRVSGPLWLLDENDGSDVGRTSRPRCLRVSFKTRLGFPDYYENNNLILMVFVISQTVWLQKMKINYHCVACTLPQLLFPLSDHCSSSSSFRSPGSRATKRAADAATATQGLPSDVGTPRDETSPRPRPPQPQRPSGMKGM